MLQKMRAAMKAATPNWTGWKTAKLVLTVIGALAADFVTTKDFDALGAAAATAIHIAASVVGQVDAIALTIVIALSGTAAGPTIQRKAP